jgi:hypothetical protein
MDYSLITNIEFADIDYYDYPDYCDAYIVRALYNGFEMSIEMLDELNEDTSYVYDRFMEYLH